MQSTLERQREMVKRKLEAKRRVKENKDYEEETATALIKMAEKQQETAHKKTMSEQGRQNSIVSLSTLFFNLRIIWQSLISLSELVLQIEAICKKMENAYQNIISS